MSKFKLALIVIAVFGMVGWGLSQASAQADAGKVAYVEFGCYDCHGNFDTGGATAERDAANPNAFGGIGPAIVGWSAEDMKPAVYDNLYQEINYFKTREPEASTFGEDELSDGDLADITAFLNPNFTDGDAANGETLYKEACFACHGSDALGKGLTGPPIVYKQLDAVIAVARTGRLPERMSGLMPLYNDSLDEATLGQIAEWLISENKR